MENFSELSLDPNINRAIKDLGYEKPSPIQALALPVLMGEKTDFIGLAATGTGKTAAFTMPLLQKIKPQQKGIQALILCPTRELSIQVAQQVKLLGKYLNVSVLPIYGGAGYDEQLRGLKQGVSIVVGTPGRLIDHLERGTLKLQNVQTVILDEADEMISMGFREDIETLLTDVPREQSSFWLFSATMSREVRRVADKFLLDPKTVQVNNKEMLSSTVEQIYYMTQEKNKPEVLCKLIDAAENFYGLIFCQTKSLVANLTRYMAERGYKVDCLHGDMSQAARETTMLAFRQKRIKILVCTDVASRGLDVKDVTHVINFSLPRELDLYVHRIGRTARSGKAGIAMSLVTPSHRNLMLRIEKLTNTRFTQGTIPTRKEIGMKQVAQLREKFMAQNPQRVLELMDENWRQIFAQMSSEEIGARFLALLCPWIFAEKTVLPQMQRQQPEQQPQKQQHRSNNNRRDHNARGRRRDRRSHQQNRHSPRP